MPRRLQHSLMPLLACALLGVSCTSGSDRRVDTPRLPEFDLVAISTADDKSSLFRRDGTTGQVTQLASLDSSGMFTEAAADGAVLLVDGERRLVEVSADGQVTQLDQGSWFCTQHTTQERLFANRRLDDETRVVGLFERDGTLVEEFARLEHASLCIIPGDGYLAWWGEAPDGTHTDVWVTDTQGANKRFIADRPGCTELVSDTHGTLLVYARGCASDPRGETVVVDVASGDQRVIGPTSGGARFSPDGKWIAMSVPRTSGAAPAEHDVWVVSVEGGQPVITVPSASWPAWVPAAEE